MLGHITDEGRCQIAIVKTSIALIGDNRHIDIIFLEEERCALVDLVWLKTCRLLEKTIC